MKRRTRKTSLITLTLFAVRFSVSDVKEIRCTEEDAKNGVGTAKVVFEYSDVTPFGIVRGCKNGDKQTEVLSFKRYEDLGWVLASEL